ncbi:MAG: hypothetical protein WCU88_02465 [Elusimicrobiota bacterium]|jgi:hypothetical protein
MRGFLLIGVFLFSTSAHADITDTGDLNIRGQGIIGGTMTVQGNAFSVGGAIAASSATLSASGANTYSLTLSSSIHLTAGGIAWADGSVSTTGRISSGSSSSGHIISTGTDLGGYRTFIQRSTLAFDSSFFTIRDSVAINASIVSMSTGIGFLQIASSRAFVPANSTSISASVLGVAVANSSVTFTTTRAGRHYIHISVPIRISDPAASLNCGILQNGSFFEGQNTTLGSYGTNSSPNSGDYVMMGPPYHTSMSYPAGTYTYAITCSVSAGNAQFCSNLSSARDATCFVEAGELAENAQITSGPAISIPASTATIIPDWNTGNTSPTDIPESTITLTMNGGNLLVGFSCPHKLSAGSGYYSYLQLLVNGSIVHRIEDQQNNANWSNEFDFAWLNPAVTYSGPTSLFLRGFRGGSGTLYIGDSTGGTSNCRLWAQEVRNVAGTGDVASNGNNTFIGVNTDQGPRVQNSSFTANGYTALTDGFVFGQTSGPNLGPAMPQNAFYAKSADGASQSAGCVGFFKMSSPTNSSAEMIWTSTTTSALTRANGDGIPAVLLQTCAPGAWCRVSTRGIFWITADSSGITDGHTLHTSSTRCRVHTNGVEDANTIGYKLGDGSVSGDTSFWAFIGGR